MIAELILKFFFYINMSPICSYLEETLKKYFILLHIDFNEKVGFTLGLPLITNKLMQNYVGF